MSTSLLPHQKKLCLDITKKLRNHPCASIFNEPVNNKDPTLRDYFKKIRNPQDLGSIYDRLLSDEYTSVTQWENDINTVWSNAETYNGANSTVGWIANYLSSVFQKLKAPLDMHNTTNWTRQVYSLTDKLDHYFIDCPDLLQDAIPQNFNQAEEYILPSFSSKDISAFIKASEILNSPQDTAAICKILSKYAPKTNLSKDNIIVDVNNLSKVALHALRDYFKKKLVELRIPYPQS